MYRLFSIFIFMISFSVQARVKEWTSLVYVNYDNFNRGSYENLITKLNLINFDKDINIVIQGDNGQAERLLLTKDGLKSQQKLGEIDSADPTTIESFLQWGIKNFPAKRYMLTVMTMNDFQALNGDFSSENQTRLVDFGKVIQDVAKTLPKKKFDIIHMPMPTMAFFSSYTADLTFLLEFDQAGDVFVGPDDNIGIYQTESMIRGVFNHFVASKDKSNEEVGEQMADAVKYSLAATTSSAIKMKNLRPLAKALEEVAISALDVLSHDNKIIPCLKKERFGGSIAHIESILDPLEACAQNHPLLKKQVVRAIKLFGTRSYIPKDEPQGSAEEYILIRRFSPGKVHYRPGPGEWIVKDLVPSKDGKSYTRELTFEKIKRWSFFVQTDFKEAVTTNVLVFQRTDFPKTSPIIKAVNRYFVIHRAECGLIVVSREKYIDFDELNISKSYPNLLKLLRIRIRD